MSHTVELSNLRSSGSCGAQRLTFRHDLADQPDLLRFGGVKAATGQQQVAHHCIAYIPLQARDPSESRNQSQAQFRKTEAGHLVGNDQIANQSEFEPTAESHTVDGGNGGQGRRIDAIQHAMYPLQKLTHATNRLRLLHRLRALVQFPQIGTSRKSSFQRRCG